MIPKVQYYCTIWTCKGQTAPFWKGLKTLPGFIWCRQPKGKGDNTVNAPFSPDKVGLALQIWLSNQEEVSQNDSGKNLINDK